MKGSGYPGYCGGKMTESQCTWSTNSCKSGQVGGKNTKKKNKNNSKKKGGNNNLLYNGYCGVTGPENQHLISQCTYNLPCGPSVNFKGGNRSKKKYNKKGGDIVSGLANMIAAPLGLSGNSETNEKYTNKEIKDLQNKSIEVINNLFNEMIEKKNKEIKDKEEKIKADEEAAERKKKLAEIKIKAAKDAAEAAEAAKKAHEEAEAAEKELLAKNESTSLDKKNESASVYTKNESNVKLNNVNTSAEVEHSKVPSLNSHQSLKNLV